MDFSVSIAANVVNAKMAVFVDRMMVFVNALVVGLAPIVVKVSRILSVRVQGGWGRDERVLLIK